MTTAATVHVSLKVMHNALPPLPEKEVAEALGCCFIHNDVVQ